MATETVTVNLGIEKTVIENEADLYALRDQLKTALWFGGVTNSRNVDGTLSDDVMQMTSPDNQVLVVKIGDVVVLINGVYAAMTPEDYQGRYGTPSP